MSQCTLDVLTSADLREAEAEREMHGAVDTRSSAYCWTHASLTVAQREAELIGVAVGGRSFSAAVDLGRRTRASRGNSISTPSLDASGRRCPARVVRGEREPLVAVRSQEVEVPRAVADVDLGVARSATTKRSPPVRSAMPFAVSGQELHQADRARRRARVRVEPALGVDHRREQRGVEVVVPRVRADDVLVLERVARSAGTSRARPRRPRRPTPGDDERPRAAAGRHDEPHEPATLRRARRVFARSG